MESELWPKPTRCSTAGLLWLHVPAESVLLGARIQINNQLGKSPNDHSSRLDAAGGAGEALMLTFGVPVVSLEIQERGLGKSLLGF